MRSMVHLAKLDSTDAMKHFSRRSFLASAGAVAAGPALGAPRPSPTVEVPRSGWVDAVIVGAGAAGIAAARRLTAAGKRYVLIEAAEEVGGRCITDTKIFGVPYDRGAHALYAGDINPMTKLAVAAGFDLYRAPPGQRIRIGKRYAREGEMEDFLAGLVRANSAIADAARKSDVACSQVLPKDLGEWRPTIEFVLGPYTCGKELSEVSTVDLARSGEHDNGSFCRQGLGALLTKLAAGLPILLGSPVKTIESCERNCASRSIVRKANFGPVPSSSPCRPTCSPSGKIKFAPDLPKRHLDAANKLKLGSHDHIALELTGNPLGLRADELVFEQSDEPADSGDLRQHVRLHDLRGRRGRHVRPRAFRQGRGGDGRFCCQLARRPLRRRHKELGQAPSRHALEQRAVGARRVVRRGAGRATGAQDPDGAGQRPHLLRR